MIVAMEHTLLGEFDSSASLKMGWKVFSRLRPPMRARATSRSAAVTLAKYGIIIKRRPYDSAVIRTEVRLAICDR